MAAKRRAVDLGDLRPWLTGITSPYQHESQKIQQLLREAVISRLMSADFADFIQSVDPEWLSDRLGIPMSTVLKFGTGQQIPSVGEIALIASVSPLSAYQITDLIDKQVARSHGSPQPALDPALAHQQPGCQ